MKKYQVLAVLMAILLSIDFINAQVAKMVKGTDRLTQEIEYTLTEATKQFLFGNLSGSKFLFEKCIEVDKNCAVAYFMLSGLETLDGNINLAENYAVKAFNLNKENRYYKENLANVLILAGNKKEALRIITDLNDRNPSVEMVIRIARLEDELGYYKKAINILNWYNKPLNEIISQEQIRILRKYNRNEEAYKSLSNSNRAFPENIVFAGDLALLAAGLKKFDVAETIFKNYVFRDEVPEEFVYHAIRFFLYRNEKQMADSIISKNEELILNSYDRKYKRASLWASEKLIVQNYEDYINSLIDDGINEGHNPGQWIKLRAGMLQVEGKEEEAVNLLENSLETGIKTEEIYNQLLYILNLRGDKKLEKYAGEAVKLYPGQPGFRILYGIGLMLNEDYNEMVLVLEEVVNENLEKNAKVQVLIFLGEGYRKLGRNELSDAVFDSALIDDPFNDLLLNNYSYYLAERSEELGKADKMSRILMNINNQNPTYLDTRAWVVYKLGNAGMALKLLRKAEELGGGSNWVIMQHLGDVCYCLGKESRAVNYWKKAAELNGMVFSLEKQEDRVRKEKEKLKYTK
jgi:tetratricopeptide (TPR) repeat protein